MDTKKLRQKILDLAIRGKLVPQDPNDEPASVLLERIRAEKEQLIKEGKIKRSKKSVASDTSHYENVPNNWAITSFEEIVELISGRDLETSSCNDIKEGIPYLIGASNIVKRSLFITRWTTKPIVISQKNDILISCKGTIGEVIRNTIGDIHIARQFMALRNNSIVDTNYIELYIRAILERIKSDARGVIPGISREDILCREILLPPLNEQKRIVLEANKLISIIEKINVDKNELVKAIAAYKLTILQLAITGKLMPQDLSDEPAIDLLRRVNPNYKPCDNRHYGNLPDSWEICQLKDIFDITMGQSPAGNTINGKCGTEFHQGKINFTDKYLSESGQYTTTPSKTAAPESLLLCVRAPVGVVNITKREICIGRGLCSLLPKYDIDCLYWLYMLSTLKDYFEENATGSTFKAISGDIIRNACIPFPPLSEQKRILSKINELFGVVDKIAAEL